MPSKSRNLRYFAFLRRAWVPVAIGIASMLLELGGDGGLIAVDTQGNIAMPFNTEGMYRACKTSLGQETVLIYSD